MKKIINISAAIALAGFFSSCGVSRSFIINNNQISTQVQLTGNNYKVIDKVSGSAEVSYILLIGGLNQKQLYENAYSAMMDKANLANGSRAIINIVTEEHVGGIPPFYFKRTVHVSAHVIEFIK